MRSICASSRPPSFGSASTLAGQFEKRSVPTRRAQASSAQTLSVSDGNRLTMRCGGAASTSVAPRSSRNETSAYAAAGNSATSRQAAQPDAGQRAARRT